MRVAVVGAGYVGLVSGVCLAAKGHDVTCVDINKSIVDRLNQGVTPIFEKNLPELLQEVIKAEKFRATVSLEHALRDASLVIIAVGTPSENGVIDLTYVCNVARQIGEYIKKNNCFLTVVVKSTVIPGTTDTVVRQELERASSKKLGEFGLGMNPEFLREGEAIEDFMYPDRVVMGYETPETLQLLEELYEPWNVDKVRVNSRTAELIKYANNTLLATQISAVNEIANLAATLGGIDTMHVVSGVHLDKRWNPIIGTNRLNPQILKYLVPGCGFGGSCFPKDVQALRSQGVGLGIPMRMLSAVLEVNEAQPQQVVNILSHHLNDLVDVKVLVLGLAFKPGTDDVRESASLEIVRSLLCAGAQVSVHDPIAAENFAHALGATAVSIEFVDDWRTSLSAVGVVVLATCWPEYAEISKLDITKKVIFDARRMLQPEDVLPARYLTIGRRVDSLGVQENNFSDLPNMV